MDKRREELNNKRSRLEALRRQRSERKTSSVDETANLLAGLTSSPSLGRSQTFSVHRKTSSIDSSTGPIDIVPEVPQNNTEPLDAKKNLNLLVDSLVGEQNPLTVTQSVPSSSIPEDETIKTSLNPPEQPKPQEPVQAPAKERILYNREVQTIISIADGPQYNEEEVQKRIKEAREKDEEERKRLEQEAAAAAALAEEEARKTAEAEADAALEDLPEEEKEAILKEEGFGSFFDSASKVIERALSEKYDYLMDYTVTETTGTEDQRDTIKLVTSYAFDTLTRHRSVMDLAWSPKFPELLLAAYNRSVFANNASDGLVCVWNLHLADRPEFVLHASSDVLTARFSEFHPHVILGGTYSGQVVIWDTRAASKLPTLSSPLTSSGHTHPVYNLHLVGTHQALNAVSASSDGLVCTWQLDMLAQPQEILELAHSNHPRTDEVAVTKLGFLANETSTFLVGTEEGSIYHVHRYERAGSKSGIHPHHHYRGHTGPVTGLSCHPTQPNGQMDFSDLFLTSSFDWSVKLWRTKSPTQTGSTNQSQALSCIHSFEHNGDYVYDVSWSPIHPAVFGVIDGCGNFDLWNLNIDTEAPVITTQVSNVALNKLTWHSSGTKVAIGASDGKVFVYELAEFAIPVPEDWETFQATLNDLESASALSNVSSNNISASSSSILGGYTSNVGSYSLSALRTGV